jgi:hypothetical protein
VKSSLFILFIGIGLAAGCSDGDSPKVTKWVPSSIEGVWRCSLYFDFEVNRLPGNSRNIVIKKKLDSISITGLYRAISEHSTVFKEPIYPVVKGLLIGTTLNIPKQELPTEDINYLPIVISGNGSIEGDSIQISLKTTTERVGQSPETKDVSFSAKRICPLISCRDYIRQELLGEHNFVGVRKNGVFSTWTNSWNWSTADISRDLTVDESLLPFEVKLLSNTSPPQYGYLESFDHIIFPFQEPYSGSSASYASRIEYREGMIYFFGSYSYRFSAYYDSLVAQ